MGFDGMYYVLEFDGIKLKNMGNIYICVCSGIQGKVVFVGLCYPNDL
jgi:hypothetical protein